MNVDTNKNTPKLKDVKNAMKRYNDNATTNNLSHAQARAARKGVNGPLMIALILSIAGIAAVGLL